MRLIPCATDLADQTVRENSGKGCLYTEVKQAFRDILMYGRQSSTMRTPEYSFRTSQLSAV